jgi:hypothetical protein
MKPNPIVLRSADAFQKWSDEHRVQIWTMIERLGKGEVTCKEARDVLREEKKALSAVSKQVLGFKTGPGSQVRPPHLEPGHTKTSKGKRAVAPRTSASGEANLRTGRLDRLIPVVETTPGLQSPSSHRLSGAPPRHIQLSRC